MSEGRRGYTNMGDGSKLEPFAPTRRQQIAQALMGDSPGRLRRRMVEEFMGTSGLSESGLGFVDATPLGAGLDVEEAVREGDYQGAALALMPVKANRLHGVVKNLEKELLPGYAGGGLLRKGVSKAAKLITPGGSDVPMPAIKTREQLFDYDKLDRVPDVPQFDLERTEPKRGPSARVGDIVNDKKVVKQVEAVVDKGAKMGGVEWYNTDQLRERFVGELGEEAGQVAYKRYFDMVAATSPRSKVDANARNASYYYSLDRQGLPMPGDSDKLPSPYGHLAQKNHKRNAASVVSEDGWDIFKNPKPASFVQNLIGNQRPATVDAHAFKLPALIAEDPRFLASSYKSSKNMPTVNPRKMHGSGELSMHDALKTPAMWDGAPAKNEYAALEDMYQGIADRKGLTPAQTQASAWVGGGAETGLMSSADPFLKTFEDRVQLTAERTGLRPEDVLRRFIRGELPLHKKGGYVDCGPSAKAGHD